LLAGNFRELLVMLGASLVGLPVPPLPVQLLWINLGTDGLPAPALVMDPADEDTLLRWARHMRGPLTT
jgi:Ca2+-transporting ATPase